MTNFFLGDNPYLFILLPCILLLHWDVYIFPYFDPAYGGIDYLNKRFIDCEMLEH